MSNKNCLVIKIGTDDIGFVPVLVWNPCPSRKHRVKPYRVPKKIRIGTRDTDESGARFSPAPFAVIVSRGKRQKLICVRADRGFHRWNFVEFNVTGRGVSIKIDLEGHTPVKRAEKHIHAELLSGEKDEMPIPLLARGLKRWYPAASRRKPSETPAWWGRPIYCGCGDQVAISLELEGPGREPRSMAYCTQGLYQRWVERLERAGVPIGTIIIDSGWSSGGVWKPYPNHWPDLREFIESQHERGRRVLLWIAAFAMEDLPKEWCICAGGTKIVADPTNAQYRAFLRAQVRRLLSPEKGCFNADGFKIDQLGFIPVESNPRLIEQFGRFRELGAKHPPLKLAGTAWGCEMLYMLQKEIYDAAKSAKKDALVTSSTMHPYFHDTFDMARLHDTGNVKVDVFEAMKARAELARTAVPRAIVDADDWITADYRKWMDYTLRSFKIGVPCIFYAERFVRSFSEQPVVLPVPEKDLHKIGKVWTAWMNRQVG